MPAGVVDERGFNLLRRMREEAGEGLTLAEFKQVLRDQFFTLLLDERRAVEAIPAMLAKEPDNASHQISNLRRLIDVVELRGNVEKARWAEIEKLIEDGRRRGMTSASYGDKLHLDPGRSVRAHAARR
jgi:hypothetical protein